MIPARLGKLLRCCIVFWYFLDVIEDLNYLYQRYTPDLFNGNYILHQQSSLSMQVSQKHRTLVFGGRGLRTLEKKKKPAGSLSGGLCKPPASSLCSIISTSFSALCQYTASCVAESIWYGPSKAKQYGYLGCLWGTEMCETNQNDLAWDGLPVNEKIWAGFLFLFCMDTLWTFGTCKMYGPCPGIRQWLLFRCLKKFKEHSSVWCAHGHSDLCILKFYLCFASLNSLHLHALPQHCNLQQKTNNNFGSPTILLAARKEQKSRWRKLHTLSKVQGRADCIIRVLVGVRWRGRGYGVICILLPCMPWELSSQALSSPW